MSFCLSVDKLDCCTSKLRMYSQKYLPGEKFRQFCHLVLLAKFILCTVCPVLMIREHMVTFIVLAKILFHRIVHTEDH